MAIPNVPTLNGNYEFNLPAVTNSFAQILAGYNENFEQIDETRSITSVNEYTVSSKTWTVCKIGDLFAFAWCECPVGSLTMPRTNAKQFDGLYRGVTTVDLSGIFDKLYSFNVNYASNGMFTGSINGTEKNKGEIVRWCPSDIASETNQQPCTLFAVGKPKVAST